MRQRSPAWAPSNSTPCRQPTSSLPLSRNKRSSKTTLPRRGQAAPQLKGAAGVEQGSSAAVAAVNAAILNAQGSGADPQKRIEEVLKQIKEKNVRQEQLLRDIREAVARDGGVQIV